MTAVPGTFFTKEQLRAEVNDDGISFKYVSPSTLNNDIGFIYRSEKKQYDKALGWYIMAVRASESNAEKRIGELYHDGLGVPQNHLCAMKWFLQSARLFGTSYVHNDIGELFENGQGVPMNKFKALEWYCHGKRKTDKERLKAEGYHRSIKNKKKTLKQLKKETEAILDAEKKKLKEKQDKTQEEMETLEQLKGHKAPIGAISFFGDL